MNDESTEVGTEEEKARAAILRILESRNSKARFFTELFAALARTGVSAEVSARLLTQLADEGAIMVRDHFCADPHLAGVDLRIAALVDRRAAEPEASAIRAIDAAWDKWLAEYLANHRCS
jgi:hypothetical protein